MKIPHLGPGSASPPSRSQLDDAAAGSGADNQALSAAPSYMPSQELLQLLDLARAEAEVRENRVAAVAIKLEQGFYHSLSSAQATAAAILSGVD